MWSTAIFQHWYVWLSIGQTVMVQWQWEHEKGKEALAGFAGTFPVLWSPQYLLNRLQKVQNNAACLILKAPKTDHITPHLCALHWLPFDVRIKYKLCSLCFGAISSTGPVYLSSLFKIYTHCRQLWSSADICILCMASFNTNSYSEHSLTPLQCSGTHFHTLPKDQNFSVSFFP